MKFICCLAKIIAGIEITVHKSYLIRNYIYVLFIHIMFELYCRSHFCCTQEHVQNKNWNTKEHTKVVWEYRHVTFQMKHGYTKCKTFGWSRCSLYKEGYA